MERTPVESSAIRSVAYDRESQRLTIEFQSGAVYDYEDVPLETYEGLMGAASKGEFFQANVREQFAYSRPMEAAVAREHWRVREAVDDDEGGAPPPEEPESISRHTWRVDVLEDNSAAVEVDGRAITSIPRWILPMDAKEGDVFTISHARGATRSTLAIVERRA